MGASCCFATAPENCFTGEADEALCATLDRSLVMGLDVLCDGRRRFLNCTRAPLINGLVMLLAATSTVVEILGTVPSHPEVMAACHAPKQRGYGICAVALSEFGRVRLQEGNPFCETCTITAGRTDPWRWVRLIAAVGAGRDEPTNLVLSLVRGRFCEWLAPKVPPGESDLFLRGLLWLIDAMLETPLETVREKMPLDAPPKSVLLGQASVLLPGYQLMRAQEGGEWEAAALSEGLPLHADEAAACSWQAQQWARQLSVEM